MNVTYKKNPSGIYALYSSKGSWKESASVKNEDLDMHYEKQYEEEQLNEAFKQATVIDCTSESNDKELLEKQLKKQIEENARLHMELAKMRSWKEKVFNLISEKS